MFLDQPSSTGNETPFDLSDRGLLLGDGVFDTSMVLAGKVIFADQHAQRLIGDAATLGINLDPARLQAAIARVVQHNANAALRVTVTRGAGARGLAPSSDAAPTVIASCAALDAARIFSPIRVVVTDVRRNETSPCARHKTLSYLDAVLAIRDAAAVDAHEALFLNTQGRVACFAAANVFTLEGEILRTPPVNDGALPGVIRGWIFANAGRVGLAPVEANLTLESVRNADAVFATNSLRLIAPVYGLATEAAAPIPPPLLSLMALLRDDLAEAGGVAPFPLP